MTTFAIRPAVGEDGAPLGLAAALTATPYLARLAQRRPQHAALIAGQGPQAALEAAIAAADAVTAQTPASEAMAALRAAKALAHLAIAVADLAGLWPLARVTGAISAFADAAVRAAARQAGAAVAAAGELLPEAGDHAGPRGLVLIAMGKHGAHELNYSSDIDVSVFYDPQRLPLAPRREAPRAALKLAQAFVRILEEQTPEGYVFRTDLRLRPDPGATPVAVSLPAALHYYQSVGQNWERAAFIKARPVGGDLAAGAAFLEELTPFIWRRFFDYAAIADIQAIKRQIRSSKGSAALAEPAFDVKLGRGGIRDIELFAQTQQLILGGRDPRLRAPGTVAALRALQAAGKLSPAACADLMAAYEFLRGVEHRAQMIEDRQTHKTPEDPAARAAIGRLCGYGDAAAFDAALIACRACVAEIDATLFAETPSLAAPAGSLSFTGVENDPETLETLAAMGFAAPETVAETIRGWHHGRVRAMRTARARELLTVLTPQLLRAIADSGDPDHAFARFADFFAGLNAGVQLLSLLQNQPGLLGDLAMALAASPRIGAALARMPGLVDQLAEPRIRTPLEEDPPGERAAILAAALDPAGSFEAALDAARRFHREEAFRIDLQMLQGIAAPEAASEAHTDLAEACLHALNAAAAAETTRRFGPAPGPTAVMGLGKLGGRELAEGSDLDLMVIYDAEIGSGGGEWAARFTQRLITALSAPTAEGMLYAVDMQLRPSGAKGPVAVRLAAFEHYYREDAWTWELLALTRLRAAAGDAALGARAEAIARSVLAAPREAGKIRADAAAMRARMDRERPGAGLWDLKLTPGGLVDLEFIAQTLQIIAAGAGADVLRQNTGAGLAALAAHGALAPAEGEALQAAWRLYSRLQQHLRLAETLPPGTAPKDAGLQARLAAAAGAADFAALEAELAARQAGVRAAFTRLIG